MVGSTIVDAAAARNGSFADRSDQVWYHLGSRIAVASLIDAAANGETPTPGPRAAAVTEREG
jgi:hypothetical protein